LTDRERPHLLGQIFQARDKLVVTAGGDVLLLGIASRLPADPWRSVPLGNPLRRLLEDFAQEPELTARR
jgi:hypothetical protein